jgi:MoaA/NifB/PqqE/SkfB family radical SAM enzyme
LKLKGVHFLLTYRCDLECDHCFVWGGPKARGVFTLEQIRNVLREAEKLSTVNYVSLEGGEPFLYYPIMMSAIEEASKFGFGVEVLSNCYWASCLDDATEWLRPMATRNVNLSLSSDLYHAESWQAEEVKNAVKAANSLNMKIGILSVNHPKAETPCPSEMEGVKVGLCELMYKGRAAKKLAEDADKKPWSELTKCPYEDLANPQRVHIDPLGYVHVCQGISIGNAWQKPFSEIIEEYNPYENPILEPLIHGGPVALVERFGLPHDGLYADACHLCYVTRCTLRKKYPDTLCPNQMYGES